MELIRKSDSRTFAMSSLVREEAPVFLVLSEVGFSRVASLDFQRVRGNGFLG